MTTELDQLCINTMRFLSVDAVQKANSGHPGMPLGAAPMAYVLWTGLLQHDPRNPVWFDRDRFVLSAGHGSMLLYSLLHLTGYDLSLDDLKQFRQWGSNAGPSRAWAYSWRRSHHRTARTGLRKRRRHGNRRSATRRTLQPPRIPDRRPCYLRHRQRRRPHGRSRFGGRLLGGPSAAWQADLFYDDNHVSLAAGTDITFTEDRARRSKPMAGTPYRSSTATTSPPSTPRWRKRAQKRRAHR